MLFLFLGNWHRASNASVESFAVASSALLHSRIWSKADDLHAMIRQENRFLVLVGDYEVGNVVPRIFMIHWTDFQEAIVQVVRVRDCDIRVLLAPDDWMNVKSSRLIWNMSKI